MTRNLNKRISAVGSPARRKPSGFEIAAERCDQCLFSSERIVDKKRMAQIVRDCRRDDTHFVCHKFTIAEGEDSQVCCRAFHDTQPPCQMLRIAERLGCVNFVPLPTKG